MSLIQWNCRGYRANFEDLKSLIMHQNSPAVLCLQETFHGVDTPNSPTRYTIYGGDPVIPYPRPPGTRASRGLITLIRNDISHYPIPLDTTLEVLAFRVGLSRQYTICNIYISPTEPVTIRSLEQLVNQLPRPFLLVGDFNAKNPAWGDSLTNDHGQVVQDFLLRTEVTLLNTNEPTYLHYNGTLSNIDLTFSSPDITTNFTWSPCDDLHGSDHFPIQISEIDSSTTISTSRYNFQKADWNKFHNATVVTRESYENISNIDELVMFFNNVVYKAANDSIPQTNPIPGKYPVPWWNQGCSIVQTDRKIARRRYQRTKRLVDKIALNKATAISRRVMKQARRKSWRNFTSSINSETPMPKIWKRVNKVQKRYSGSRAPCIEDQDVIVMDEGLVGNLLGSHFSDVSSNNSYSRQFNTQREIKEKIPLRFNSTNRESYNSEITPDEFKSALQKCSNTSPGKDNIHYIMLKNLAPSCTALLLHIFNTIFLNDVFPQRWREAILVPILKPDKPPKSVNSYRPIAMTSCVCKLLEKILNFRLVYQLESVNFFSQYQYGFRKNRSTVDSLSKLQSDIYNSFSLKNHLIAVFFDLEKAYDCTWRHHILKTVEEIGIKGHLSRYIQNFLSSRTFKVKVKSTLSETFDQSQGVPQGSVMSVTLFGIAINDIIAELPSEIQKSLFVDDLAIYFSSSTPETVGRKLQMAINKIFNWTQKTGFKLSKEKTVAVHFHRKNNPQIDPQLKIGDHAIPYKDKAKFLGMTFDKKLRWKDHIEDLRKKCTKSLNLLKCLSHTDWGSDRVSLMRIYKATVGSQLDYGCQIYASAPKDSLKKLNSIHNLAIRLCTGAFKSSPIQSLMAESGELSLPDRRDQLCIQQYTRQLRLPESPSTLTTLDNNLDEKFSNSPHSKPFGIHTRDIMSSLNHSPSPIIPAAPAYEPPWEIPENLVCSHEVIKQKSSYPPSVTKALITQHQVSCHGQSIHVYTDGSKSEQGVGFGIYSEQLSTSHKLLGTSSIYTAELYAILETLRTLDGDSGNRFTIFSDSSSSLKGIQQLNSNHPIISSIQSKIIELHRCGKIVDLCWVPSHINIYGNEQADKLAKEGSNLTSEPYSGGVHYKDDYPHIKSKIKKRWNTKWLNICPERNKLRAIKDNIKAWSTSSFPTLRKAEVVLCRLRIGHTRLTHGYLMEGRRDNECPYCGDEFLSIKHIFLECPQYNWERNVCFNNHRSLKTILGQNDQNVPISAIFRFLTITNLLSRI